MLQVATLASWGVQHMNTTFSWAEMRSTNLTVMSAHLAETDVFFATVSTFSPTPPSPAAQAAAASTPSHTSTREPNPLPTSPSPATATASAPAPLSAEREPFHIVYNFAAQFGLTRAQAWSVIEPFVSSYKKYFHTRTSFYQQPPYCFAAMANPDIQIAKAAAVAILEEIKGLDPAGREEAGWGALRILPQFEDEVRLLAEGTRTRRLHVRLTAIYAACPVTNAASETALKMLSLAGVSKMLPATVDMSCRVHHDRPFDFVHPTQAQFDAQRKRTRWLKLTAAGKSTSAAVTASAAAATTFLNTSAVSVTHQAPLPPAHRRKRKHDENTHPRPPPKITAISNVIGVSRAALGQVTSTVRGLADAEKAVNVAKAAAMSKVRAIMKARQNPTSNPKEFDGTITNDQLAAFLFSIQLPYKGLNKQVMMDSIVAWSSQGPVLAASLGSATTESPLGPHTGNAQLPQPAAAGSSPRIQAVSAATHAAVSATLLVPQS